MDEGAKLAVLIGGIGAVTALGYWIFRKIVGRPTPDPTATPREPDVPPGTDLHGPP